MEDFYPEAIYHGTVYFPVIDISDDSKINEKNFYRVLQLDKGKMSEVSTGLDIEELAKDFSLKLKREVLPKGQIMQYIKSNNDLKSPLVDKVKQFSITKKPDKIIPVTKEEFRIFKEKTIK